MPRKTSDLISEYLKRNGKTNAVELARHLDLSKASIQYHLQKMERNGQVIAEKSTSLLQRGRPQKYYSLAPGSLRNNYPALCEVLLRFISNNAVTAEPEPYFEILGRMMAEDMHITGSLPQRMRKLIHRLNRYNYEAGWVALQSGPMVTISNCPYAALMKPYPQLCTLDVEMIKTVLAVESIVKEGTIGPDGLISICRLRITLGGYK